MQLSYEIPENKETQFQSQSQETNQIWCHKCKSKFSANKNQSKNTKCTKKFLKIKKGINCGSEFIEAMQCQSSSSPEKFKPYRRVRISNFLAKKIFRTKKNSNFLKICFLRFCVFQKEKDEKFIECRRRRDRGGRIGGLLI